MKLIVYVSFIILFTTIQGCGGGIKLAPGISQGSGGGTGPTPVCGSEATLTWTAPTENTDGTPLTDLSGFNIFYGNASRTYFTTIDVANPAATTYTITGLAPGTYYFAMTAKTSAGLESIQTNEVTKTLIACEKSRLNLSNR